MSAMTCPAEIEMDMGTTPTIEVWHDRPVATSIEVADRFGKRHADVMRSVKRLVDSGRFAQARGSRLTRALAHSNVNRMINGLFGIEPGQRESLSSFGRSLLSAAQTLAGQAIHAELANGGDHKTSYQCAKKAVQGLVDQLHGQRAELLLQQAANTSTSLAIAS